MITLRVLFRVDIRARFNFEVTAILPDVPYSRGSMTCYAHIGQHSSCTRAWYAQHTRPAKPREYASLLKELRRIYRYPPASKLVVRKRLRSTDGR